MDGWAKLSREQGDYIYFVLGRVFLQGGLIELNYEFSGLEDLGEQRDVPDQHYWRFDERRHIIDPDLARFVGCLAQARIGQANRYLAYGTMCRPAPLTVEGEPNLELAYFMYSSGQDWPMYESRGTQRVPVVLQTAWQYRGERCAWLLLNLAQEARTVHLELPLPAGDGPWRLQALLQDEQPDDLGILTAQRTLTLTLPSRRPLLIEAVPHRSNYPQA